MRLIMGVGRATKGVIEYLKRVGLEYLVYDDDREKAGDHYTDSLEGIEEIIISPGFPDSHPMVQKACLRGIPIIDEIEFTHKEIMGLVIAVTGTNGKSTTAAIVANILKRRFQVFLGGNIAPGNPFSQALLDPPYDCYVLEVSSFQLERIRDFHPRVSILLNIFPDHLDRHRTFEQYIKAKFNIFKNQDQTDHAILNHDDETIRSRVDEIISKKHFFSSIHGDAYVDRGMIVINGMEVIPVDELPLKGEYNIKNVLAAGLASSVMAIPVEMIREGIKSFTGLKFRMETILKKGGIKFINNSMCTNPKAAIESLKAVDHPYVVIMGGKEKDFLRDDYPEYVAKSSDYAVVIGANRFRIEEVFRNLGFDRFVLAGEMDEAVRKANTIAGPGWTIILNPGYASQDMFKDFIDRGMRFNDAVATI